jgi:MFS family permease
VLLTVAARRSLLPLTLTLTLTGASTVPAFLLACVVYLSVALPGSTLGLLWPSMRLSFGQPVGALGILLVPGIAASVISSAITGRIRVPAGPLVAASTLIIALALGVEVIAPSMWVMIVGTVLFGIGFGALDTALNAYASRHFGARDINWMHASYGLGATLGPPSRPASSPAPASGATCS